MASVVITKLDGHAKGGGALSAVAATERYFVSNPRSGTIINLVFQPCYFHWNWRTYRQPGAIWEEAVHQQAVGNGGHWGLDGTGEGLEHGRGQDDGRHQEGPVHPEEHVWTVPEHHEAWTHITGDHTYIHTITKMDISVPGHGNDTRPKFCIWGRSGGQRTGDIFLNFLVHSFPDSKVSDQESMKRLKRLMTIMDSMNDKVRVQHTTF